MPSSVTSFAHQARRQWRSNAPFVAVAVLAAVLLGLASGNGLAQRRAVVGDARAAPTPSPLRSWQADVVAETRKVAVSAYWPLVPTYVPGDVRVQVTARDGCGVSMSPCLDYRFYQGTSSDLLLSVLQGTAGCCLDYARPKAVRDIEIHPGVRGQYIPVEAHFGGPILWWVEPTDRGPAYVAINSPVLTEDELIRVANAMRPLPPSSAASLPAAPPPPAVVLGRPSVQPVPAASPVVVNAIRQAGAIDVSLGGTWRYDGQTGTLGYLPPARPLTEHRSPQGSLVAVEHLTPSVPGSGYLVPRELAVRDGGVERVIYRTLGDAFYWSGWSPDAKYVALWEIDQYSGSVDMDGRPLVIIDIQTGARTDLGRTLLHGTTAWTAPHTLAYVAGMDRMVWDTKTLRLWSPEAGITEVTGPKVAPFAPSWSANSQSLYFVSGPSGQWDPVVASGGKGVGDRRISVYDPMSKAIRSLPHLPGYVEEGVRPSRDGAHLLVLRRRTVTATDVRSILAADLEVWFTDAAGENGTALVRFPGYGLSAYGYQTGPSEWIWSD